MTSLSEDARRDWLRLARTENVGPVTFDQLIRRFGAAGEALAALPDLARRGGRGIRLANDAAVDKELADGAALGARLIASCEPDFPATLAAIDPPPPILWARGRLDLLHRSGVAIVGARVASAAGQRFARGLASELGQAGQVIVSGLSRAVVVVEAEFRSGSLITARLAAEQGREVLAVPGSPLDPRAKGTNDLIRQGAAICESAEDVLRALEGLRNLREPDRGYGGPCGEPDDALREAVAALLSPTPVSRNELARATGAPAPLVFAALVELALAGRCELLPGGMVATA